MPQMPSPAGGRPAESAATGPTQPYPEAVPAPQATGPSHPQPPGSDPEPVTQPPGAADPDAADPDTVRDGGALEAPGASRTGPAPQPDAATTRVVGGIVLGVAAAAFGGWILGEYPFTGVMPYLTGLLFALVVAEIMLSISRRYGWTIGMAASLATMGGIGLALWIQSTEGLVAVPVGGWIAIAIGGVVALLRCVLRRGGLTAARR